MQWALAQKERGQHEPIVLLADEPKDDLDEIVDNIKAETGMNVMARSGIPYVRPDAPQPLVSLKHLAVLYR